MLFDNALTVNYFYQSLGPQLLGCCIIYQRKTEKNDTPRKRTNMDALTFPKDRREPSFCLTKFCKHIFLFAGERTCEALCEARQLLQCVLRIVLTQKMQKGNPKITKNAKIRRSEDRKQHCGRCLLQNYAQIAK